MQNAECRVQNEGRRGADLNERLLRLGARVIRLSAALPKTEEGLHIRRQILRSGTSSGANYQEARGAESRPDFIHKMQIVLKELRETEFWLKLIGEAELAPAPRLTGVLTEVDELTAIVVKSLVTARGNARHEK